MNDFETWVTQQLDQAGYLPTVNRDVQIIRTSVLALAKTFGEMNFDQADPNGRVGLRENVLKLFMHLANGHALPAANMEGAWILARKTSPALGMEARVLLDAFDGPEGQMFNGRRGHIVHNRNMIGVRFSDDRFPIEHNFDPRQIEVRIG